MEYTPGVAFPVPDNYAGEALARSFAYEDANILLYGTHRVTVLRGHKMENVFDIGKLLSPDPAHNGTGEGYLAHAGVHGDSLFLCVAGTAGSQIYALDAASGKVLWRSDSDTCSVRFAVLGDYIATASGAKPTGPVVAKAPKPQSNAFILRGDTGAVVSKIPLPSAPSDLGMSGGSRIVVVTESDYLTFTIGY
jgi:hypothetical protein